MSAWVKNQKLRSNVLPRFPLYPSDLRFGAPRSAKRLLSTPSALDTRWSPCFPSGHGLTAAGPGLCWGRAGLGALSGPPHAALLLRWLCFPGGGSAYLDLRDPKTAYYKIGNLGFKEGAVLSPCLCVSFFLLLCLSKHASVFSPCKWTWS